MALTQIDDRGLKTPIDLLDNEKIRLGTGNDLELYHHATDGSQILSSTVGLEIKDTGGFMRIRSDELKIQAATGNENYIEADANGAVQLFYDNVKKFETTAGGVTVTGGLTTTAAVAASSMCTFSAGLKTGTDEYKVQLGAGDDLELWHSTNNNSYIKNSTGELKIASDNIALMTTDQSEKFIQCNGNGGIELYHDNFKAVETDTNGLIVRGPEGDYGGLFIKADEGDDNADNWFIKALSSSSTLQILNKASGSWETCIECNGDGAVELYFDNAKKLDTHGSGISVHSEESIIKMYDESNGVNERKAIYAGLGNTASGTFTASNCHGGGTVTISGFNNGNGNISTTVMFPIQINSNGTTTLGGSSIFSINGSAGGTSFQVAAASQGITVTNGGGAFCQFRVLFDITANI